MKVLFADDSFGHRTSKNNSVPHFLSDLGVSCVESIHEGHGIVTMYSNATIRNKILKAVKDNKPTHIVLNGGIPNGSWSVAVKKLVNEIRKYSNAKIIIPYHHHVGKADSTCNSVVKKTASNIGGHALKLNQYYKPLGVKYVDTDNRHPSMICYYIEAVSLYCYLTKKRPSTKETYKSIEASLRKKIVDTVSKDYGIKATPPKTSTLVVPQPTLKKGSKGTRVKQLQMCLNHFGANLKLDGDFGNITVGSLKSWQNRNGLKPDGVYGPKSYAKMKSLI